jgi:hypothetical protein
VFSSDRSDGLRGLGLDAFASSADDVVPIFASRHRRDDDDAGGATLVAPRPAHNLLSDADLRSIEDTYPNGITAVQIVEVFTSRGIKLSEASFRKYVQIGLLPRSRRVGRKGKHKGSLGVYPAKTVRRINTVKRLMAEGHTIEEIQGEFLLYTDLVEGLGETVTALLTRLERDVHGGAARGEQDPDRYRLVREIAELRRVADDLVRRIEELARRVAAPRADKSRRTGAAGSAEDLL